MHLQSKTLVDVAINTPPSRVLFVDTLSEQNTM
jgi:hypothetical protein